jgi:hypothetical protein
MPSAVKAALVKTAAVINKAAVTFRLMVHPRRWVLRLRIDVGFFAIWSMVSE